MEPGLLMVTLSEAADLSEGADLWEVELLPVADLLADLQQPHLKTMVRKVAISQPVPDPLPGLPVETHLAVRRYRPKPWT